MTTRYDPLFDALDTALDLLEQCEQKAYTAPAHLTTRDIEGLKRALKRAVTAVKALVTEDDQAVSTEWWDELAAKIRCETP
jgi:hypothetical protein